MFKSDLWWHIQDLVQDSNLIKWMQCGLPSKGPGSPLEKCRVFLGVKLQWPLQSPLPRELTLSWYVAVTWATSWQYVCCYSSLLSVFSPPVLLPVTAAVITKNVTKILQQYSSVATWYQEGGKKTQPQHPWDKSPHQINTRSSHIKKKGTADATT